MRDIAYKYALQNAVKFDGKANAGAVMGKVLNENPELKERIAELKKIINSVIKEVNSMKLEEQLRKLKQTAPELLEEKKEEKKELKELPGAAEGKFATRIAPEPSKHLHLGHALTFLINYLYAEKYKGKCILRFEDCNPEKVKQEYADSIMDDVKNYLGIKPSKVVYISDDAEKLYDYAEQLVDRGLAYVCFCDRELMQELRHNGKECKCRRKEAKENKKEWKAMLERKYREGECTLRLKIDMKAKNQTMRDPVVFRISYTKHYRHGEKYCAWPMYDFYNAIEEHLLGINYILRSSEFGTMRTELQNYIRMLFKMENPKEIQYGRFNVNDKITQGREIRELIEQKKVIGWDDPRLVTLKALKRRGIERETYYELVKEVGLSPTETNLDFSVLAAINRRALDKKCNRYFVLVNPEKIRIENSPTIKVEIALHPDDPKRGMRKMETDGYFYVTKQDLDELKTEGKLHRLMDCMNFIYKKGKFIFDSTEYEKYKEAKNKGKIIHYLPVQDNLIKCSIMMEDATIVDGLAESAVKNVKVDERIQAERFGFLILDNIKNGKYEF